MGDNDDSDVGDDDQEKAMRRKKNEPYEHRAWNLKEHIQIHRGISDFCTK